MLRHLGQIAKSNGIHEFFGTALIENESVLRMLQSVTTSLEIKTYSSIREFYINLENIRE